MADSGGDPWMERRDLCRSEGRFGYLVEDRLPVQVGLIFDTAGWSSCRGDNTGPAGTFRPTSLGKRLPPNSQPSSSSSSTFPPPFRPRLLCTAFSVFSLFLPFPPLPRGNRRRSSYYRLFPPFFSLPTCEMNDCPSTDKRALLPRGVFSSSTGRCSLERRGYRLRVSLSLCLVIDSKFGSQRIARNVALFVYWIDESPLALWE